MPKPFPALPGLYGLLYLHLEPLSTITPALLVWIWPGAAWFRHQLVPSLDPAPAYIESARDRMAIWQLANCYLLLGLISSLVFRAARDTLSHDPISQEKIVKALLIALAIADLSHIIATLIALPAELTLDPGAWNATTHGNISFVVVLFLGRVAWMVGFGRTVYSSTTSKTRTQ